MRKWIENLLGLKKDKNSITAVLGDVICVRRANGLFEHYAVYIGNDEVIHMDWAIFTAGMLSAVQQDSLENFLAGAKTYYICNFPDSYGEPIKLRVDKEELSAQQIAVLEDTSKEKKALDEDSRLADFVSTLAEVVSTELSEEEFKERQKAYHIYTPEETVERAKSCLGQGGYDLLKNNCEHFAVWCKTGVAFSHQTGYIHLGWGEQELVKEVLLK